MRDLSDKRTFLRCIANLKNVPSSVSFDYNKKLGWHFLVNGENPQILANNFRWAIFNIGKGFVNDSGVSDR